MHTNRFDCRVLIAVLMFACMSCTTAPTSSAPTAPTPPQVTVANAVNVLAQAVDATVTTAIRARDQGTMSQADLTALENFCKAAALAGKQINAELRSPDDWPTQRGKILQTITAAGLDGLKNKISPAAQALLATLLTAANQISVSVGGPTI